MLKKLMQLALKEEEMLIAHSSMPFFFAELNVRITRYFQETRVESTPKGLGLRRIRDHEMGSVEYFLRRIIMRELKESSLSEDQRHFLLYAFQRDCVVPAVFERFVLRQEEMSVGSGKGRCHNPTDDYAPQITRGARRKVT
ncbi:MAG: hypothetical protein A2718_02835 [Candidatus Ryanbacteria bacterium RIFCSPHIGHO2_01_FULL_44_130]|nr:MAG: hypothetical protein A2718_02835 [Candidatus Ryanbacteria bacterium RIFCSPHIGHO2_01_FULL_44_130]